MEAAAVSYPEFEQDLAALLGMSAETHRPLLWGSGRHEASPTPRSRRLAALARSRPPPAHATFPGANGRIVRGRRARATCFRAIITLPPMGSGRGRDVRFVRDCQLSESGEPDSGDCAIEYRSPSWAPERAPAGVRLRGRDRAGELRPQRLRAARRRRPPTMASPPIAPRPRAGVHRPRGLAPRPLRARHVGRRGSADRGPRGARPTGPAQPDRLRARRRDLQRHAARRAGCDRIARGSAPSWSPSGRSIAFARRGGIYVARRRRQRAAARGPLLGLPHARLLARRAPARLQAATAWWWRGSATAGACARSSRTCAGASTPPSPPGSRAERSPGPSSLAAAWWWRSTGRPEPGRAPLRARRRGRSASPTSTRAPCTAPPR